MKKEINPKPGSLRQRAEELQKLKPFDLETAQLKEADMQKLLHELQVHQIELELQNNELIMEKERAATASERYVELYDFAPSGYFTLSSKGEILELNLAAAKMLGKNRLELKNKLFGFYVLPDSRSIYYLFLSRVFNNNSQELCELKLPADGSLSRYVFLTGIVNNYNQCLVTMTDITELNHAKEVIKESQLRYQKLFDEATEGLILLTMDGKIAEVNNAFASMHGYTTNELMNINIKELDVLHEKAFDSRGEIMRRIMAGEVVRFEVEHYHKDGRTLTLSDSASLIEINGQRYFMAFHQDITMAKKAEGKLIESEELFNQFMAHIPGLIYLKDEKLRLLKMSKSLTELIGRPESELIGRDSYEHFPPEFAKIAIADDMKVLREGALIEHEEELNGRIFSTTKFPIQDQHGRPTYIGGFSIDITESKLIEKELVRSKEHAEESDRLKSAFLANMSHEIRTPMNGILGFAGLLKEPGLTGEDRLEYINIIEKSGARMLNIINDIVDISKIEAGLMETNIRESNVNEQIEYLYTFFKPEAEKKGIKLLFKNTLPSKESIIKTDREKLFAILTNLIKNAIKYTDKGSIEFGYLCVEPEHVPSLLRFFVKDTGIGIPKDRQKAVFERFIQADIGDQRAFQGAGLGLAISKAYVEILSGTISVESEEGEGSTFYFTLPYNGQRAEKSVNQNISSFEAEENLAKNLKILIAEDDEESAKLISIMVRKFGTEILKVRTGTEAVEACRNHPDIDLVLMDIQMPIMDGYDATRQIRRFNSNVTIIAQTAYGLSGDREKAIEAGCTDYISKPINRDKLNSLFKTYFGN